MNFDNAMDVYKERYGRNPNSTAPQFCREVTFQVTERCNLACTYCVEGDTLITMVDGSKKPIKDIKIGDVVLGFDEYSEKHKQKKLRAAVVEKVFCHQKRGDEQVYDLRTEYGDLIITGNHKILDNDNNYQEVQNLSLSMISQAHNTVDNKSYICNNTVYSNTPIDFEGNLYNIQTSTRTYIANNVLVHNCYQIHKTPKVMPWEVAKAGVDLLFNMWIENEPDAFINQKTEFIILDFIGGEPMLEVKLIDRICDYFMNQALEINPLWAETFMISMASNGTIYFTPEVQHFLHKWDKRLSYSVSMDGPKEMHDACRIFPDGRGSFDLAKAAQDDYNKTHRMQSGTKATISWQNMPYLDTTIKYYVDQGYRRIHANTVYEEDWTPEQGAFFYKKLKEVADFMLSLDGKVEISLFDRNFFKPKTDMEACWCFGAGTKVLTDQGYKDIETIQVGDMVMTANGYQPVEATKSHRADNVVKAHVSGVFDFVCTDDHPFFCKPFDYLGNKGKKHFKEYQVLPLKEVGHKDLLPLFSYDPDFGKDYDPKLAYLVGRYIGDGWRNRSVHSICSAFDEMDELEYRLEDADIHYSKAMNKTVAQYTISKLVTDKNKELTQILSKCGQGANGKRIPEECFQWNREALEALLQGYLDADGSLKPDKKYVCNTVSRELAEDLMLLIRSLGYNPTCYFNKRAGKSTILGREVTIKDRYEIYFFADPSRSRYVQHDEDNICWTYGIKTTPTEPCTVYNLTVANNHSFVANGILVHNCGGYDSMLAFDPDGNAFPCIRYMESSLGGDMPPVIIGDVWNGLWKTPQQQHYHNCLACITWTTQNDNECLECPIAQGCADCAAESYQHMKCFNKRHKLGSCWVHRARSLANVYYWNKLWRQQGSTERFKRYLPDDIALQIISKEELEYLNSLEQE